MVPPPPAPREEDVSRPLCVSRREGKKELSAQSPWDEKGSREHSPAVAAPGGPTPPRLAGRRESGWQGLHRHRGPLGGCTRGRTPLHPRGSQRPGHTASGGESVEKTFKNGRFKDALGLISAS